MNFSNSLSIIIPVYNVEKYISICLDSLKDLSPEDYEVIIVDDCSPDNSIEVCKRYQIHHPHLFKIFYSPENRRQGGARNIGIKEAKGEYLAFVDSDDWVDSSVYKEMLDCARSNNSPDVVYSPWYWRCIEGHPPVLVENNFHRLNGIIDIEKRRKLFRKSFTVWDLVINRNYLLKNNLLFPEKISYEDNLWAIQLVWLANTVACYDKPFYYYRIHQASTTNSKNNIRLLDNLEIAIRVDEYLKEGDIKNEFKKEREFLFIFNYFMFGHITSLFYFDPILHVKIKEINECTIKRYPFFFLNKYYRAKYSFKRRVLELVSLINLKLYIKLIIRFGKFEG